MGKLILIAKNGLGEKMLE